MSGLELKLDDFAVGSDEMMAVAVYSSGLTSYKLAHFLNKTMLWNLVNIKKPYLPLENTSCLIEVYSHTDEINRIQYFLADNRYAQQFWIPKMQDVDFWIIITGPGSEFLEMKDFLQSLHDSGVVFSASLLPFDSLSGRTSSVFRYFQSFYDEMDNRGVIHHFE